jgi:hypothetical protein
VEKDLFKGISIQPFFGDNVIVCTPLKEQTSDFFKPSMSGLQILYDVVVGDLHFSTGPLRMEQSHCSGHENGEDDQFDGGHQVTPSHRKCGFELIHPSGRMRFGISPSLWWM